MMEESEGLPMNVLFTASSCVPASPLETSGAELGAAELRLLLEDDRVVALAEMMNVPGVVRAVPAVLEKVRAGLERRMVDGHCPGLGGAALQAYVAAGIGSDHECTTAAEAEEKLRLGMRIFIREGGAARNLDALLPVVTPANAHRFCFCTDDRHPRALAEEGHIDHLVRRAIDRGLDPVLALAVASLHAAEHYRLDDLGAVAPGRLADLVVLDDPDEPRPRQVYFHGRLVAEAGRLVDEVAPRRVDPTGLLDSVHLPADLDAEALAIPADGGADRIRVIGMDPHQHVTADLRLAPAVADGRFVADPGRDLLKLAVIERHRATGRVGLGFVRGFGLREGALASTVGHDAHNLVIVGADDGDMIVAARALERCGGGQAVASGGVVRALLELPIAGLLSDGPAETVLRKQETLLAAAHSIGCPLEDPFMPLSFLPLTVIPTLKLSDRGLVDVDRFEVVPLVAD
jgi:adenine deaminase